LEAREPPHQGERQIAPCHQWIVIIGKELATAGEARGVLALIEALEDHDDVADTYANVDVPDEVAAELSAE
ncbi:MAG: hypothetical protein ACRCW4_10395, partial [Candidatus Neomicrothrix subdominans]